MPAILTYFIWWPTFACIDSPLFLLSAQCVNTESITKGAMCHIGVWKHLGFSFSKSMRNILNTPQDNSGELGFADGI